MLQGRRFLAVVPARGGSKSVPRKNLLILGGKPLLVHTLEQAATVAEIDLTVVSTEDAEIARVATDWGRRVVNRPPELATDESRTESALLHALSVLEVQDGLQFDYVITLEPTSPLRRSETIRRCMQTIVERNGRSLMTVIETRSNYGRLIDGVFHPLDPAAPRRRQDREPLYVESSTVYIATIAHLRETGSLVAEDWLAVEVPEAEAVDINSPADVRIAEAMLVTEQE